MEQGEGGLKRVTSIRSGEEMVPAAHAVREVGCRASSDGDGVWKAATRRKRLVHSSYAVGFPSACPSSELRAAVLDDPRIATLMDGSR